MLAFTAARDRLVASARVVEAFEWVPTAEAAGRVLAQDCLSALAVPAMACSTMDGYAVRAAELTEEGQVLPVSQRIPAGGVATHLVPGTAARIFTGAPLPEGADAVVMQEFCELVEGGVSIGRRPRVGEAVRATGSDIALGERVLAAGCRLNAPLLGLAASIGLARLPVYRRLRVALFSTGNELVMPGMPLPPGGLYNSNRFMLRALIEGLGCELTDFGIVADDLAQTRACLREAAQAHDLIVTSGGVSVGEEDHVKPAVEAEGTLDVWKIAMKPGKPLAFGQVGRARFIGLPGNPVSSFVTFVLMVRPFILAAQGCSRHLPSGLRLAAGFDWPHPDLRREFLRARLDEQGLVVLHPNQGASALVSTGWASGLVEIPENTGIGRGDCVHFLPYAELMD